MHMSGGKIQAKPWQNSRCKCPPKQRQKGVELRSERPCKLLVWLGQPNVNKAKPLQTMAKPQEHKVANVRQKSAAQ